jgi:hypothetical protein
LGDIAGVDDPNVQIGVMQRVMVDKQDIAINHIGQINPDTKEMQAMVEGYYCMTLEL